MASPKTNMIIAIRNAINAIPNIGSFRGFNGQFDDNREHPLKFPCVLWELSTIDWRQMKNPNGIGIIQRALNGEIILHVGVRSFGDDPNVDDHVFEIADSVAAAVAEIDADEFGRFHRLSEAMDVQHETVVDHQITFKFQIIDVATFAGETTIGIIKTLQETGDIQESPPNAIPLFGETPTHGTDDPTD
tara:strand:+ start:163 stop:729 length:567 start_codon:yes stop_codon:yes gene_type:complete